ncbi:MAG: DNA-3-methyladenine glycosylase [Desulfurococcales archaeon]|nr:DNA-3-methyladenine glycosylase [Desulfurococcales archaeon]
MGERILPASFYQRDPATVAREILGMTLVRILGSRKLTCRIAETEAYYGPEDPASRAHRHRRGRIVERLRGPPGVTLVYGIHRQWLLNIVAHPVPGWGAVLLRACEPLEGFSPGARLNGPGLLTRALHIDKSLDGVPVYSPESPLRVEGGDPPLHARVCRDHRIGVSKDVPEKLRFCIKDSKYVSRPCRDCVHFK